MILTQTALRLSLLGGNTDFRDYFLNYGGLVLSTTIDKYIYCIVKKRFDDKIIVNYTIKETVDDVNDIKHELVRESLKMLGITKGIEITFLADIPSEGTGLGSSSAVTIGLLNALHNYQGQSVTNQQLAEEAINIELDVLKKPIGIQDQHAIALGGLRCIQMTQLGEVFGMKVEMNESVKEDFNNSLMLFYTGVSRKTDGVLKGFDVMDNRKLLDQNKVLAKVGTEELLRGNLKKFGKLLDVYWNVKKQMNAKTTTTEIDKMYETAKKAGAIGGKVIGAGGGGFLLVMFPANKRAKIKNALKDYKELPFRFTDCGSRVIHNI